MFTVKSFYSGSLYAEYNQKIEDISKQTKLVDNNEYELFYTQTNVPHIIRFGCKQLKDDYRNKAGYIWSSRASCINKEWNTRYIQAYINNSCFGIDADFAALILEAYLKKQNKGYTVSVRKLNETDKDVSYTLDIYLDGVSSNPFN